jgi:hypothetical protein
MGLSDKIGAATLASGHALGAKSPYDVAGPSDSWLEAYHKNLDALRQEGEKFSETNPTASKVATTAGTVGSIAALPSRGIAATAGLLPKIGEGAKIGAVAGGIGGFGGSKDESPPGLGTVGSIYIWDRARPRGDRNGGRSWRDHWCCRRRSRRSRGITVHWLAHTKVRFERRLKIKPSRQ